jgi:hypothetical protein
MMLSLGKLMVIAGLVLLVVGGLLMFSDRLSFLRIGRLPGDVIYRRGNFTFYFPIVTSIAISLILTLLFYVFGRR